MDEYREQRIRVSEFGTLPAASELLVGIPSAPGCDCKLHVLAAGDFLAMSAECRIATGIALEACSGWRAHRWKSREAYEAVLVAQYGSVAIGQRFLAFNSPHETGLAVDLQCGGLRPNSATAPKQRSTPLHAWLVANAHRYGWHPYLPEPWHWEHWIDPEAWRTGVATAEVPRDCA